MYKVILLLAAFAISFALIRVHRRDSSPATLSRRPRDALMDLLSPLNAPLSELLQSRAIANRRLVRAFALTNTFVSPTVDVHNAFVRRARELIRNTDWAVFTQVAEKAVIGSITMHSPALLSRYESNSGDLDFAEFVQDVTLKTMIIGVLDVDREDGVDSLDPEDIRVAAQLIMELWALSKTNTRTTTTVDSSHLLQRLNLHLRRLLPDAGRFPNPVDLVIPTWETMWRVVAVCLARAYNVEKHRQVFNALSHFQDSSTTQRIFSCRHPESGLSASAIVAESLRLHPPSRHINRAFVETSPYARYLPQLLSSKLGLERLRVEVADVEGAHVSQSEDIWGPNASVFDPGRWEASLSSEDPAAVKASSSGHPQEDPCHALPQLFAFGHGRLRCVAENWAPVAVGVIVAALLKELDKAELEVSGPATIGGRTGWGGWVIRRKKREDVMFI